MSSNDYHFVSHWRVEGDVSEVSSILEDSRELPRWWPSVYLAVDIVEPGDGRGVGKRVRLVTKGWLPYMLRWQLRITESRKPYGFSLDASGDLEGRGIWSFRQDGPFVDMTYDWRIRAEKPLLRHLSFLLKPIFAANHRWAMARGEESLKLELRRRRADTAEGRLKIPAPPHPTFDWWIRNRAGN